MDFMQLLSEVVAEFIDISSFLAAYLLFKVRELATLHQPAALAAICLMAYGANACVLPKSDLGLVKIPILVLGLYYAFHYLAVHWNVQLGQSYLHKALLLFLFSASSLQARSIFRHQFREKTGKIVLFFFWTLNILCFPVILLNLLMAWYGQNYYETYPLTDLSLLLVIPLTGFVGYFLGAVPAYRSGLKA